MTETPNAVDPEVTDSPRNAAAPEPVGSAQPPAEDAWLTVPDLVERLGVTPGRVRRLLEDRILLATRIDGVLKVPALFLEGDAPLKELRGTLLVLADAGFSDDEAMRWLLEHDDALRARPIDALRAGRRSEVRRVAQALGF